MVLFQFSVVTDRVLKESVSLKSVDDTASKSINNYFEVFFNDHMFTLPNCILYWKLIDQAKSVGKYLKSELEQALKGTECVKEIRGKGLFLGIELNEPSIAAETMENMMKEGVLVGKTGPKNNVIKLRPPMTINSKHADFLVNKLSLCLEKTN